MIAERPTEVATRAVPGHWERDLVMGTRNRSAIATLVERTTRYLVLVHLPDGHSAQQLSTALIHALGPVPSALRCSLTWDQGREMGCHGDFTIVSGTPVLCDPGSPWQRGRRHYPRSPPPGSTVSLPSIPSSDSSRTIRDAGHAAKHLNTSASRSVTPVLSALFEPQPERPVTTASTDRWKSLARQCHSLRLYCGA